MPIVKLCEVFADAGFHVPFFFMLFPLATVVYLFLTQTINVTHLYEDASPKKIEETVDLMVFRLL